MWPFHSSSLRGQDVTKRILFRIGFPYEEREVEDVLEDLEQAGAHYEKLEGIPGGFELFIPPDANYDFCSNTLLACQSLQDVIPVYQDMKFSE